MSEDTGALQAEIAKLKEALALAAKDMEEAGPKWLKAQRDAVVEAYERAAKVCDLAMFCNFPYTAEYSELRNAAAAIRDLAKEPDPSTFTQADVDAAVAKALAGKLVVDLSEAYRIRDEAVAKERERCLAWLDVAKRRATFGLDELEAAIRKGE